MKEDSANELDAVQQAAARQFSKQSRHYGKGHILEDVSDIRDALARIVLPAKARVLDVATGGGHTGLLLASLGHQVTLADISEAMLQRASELASSRGLSVTTLQHTAEAMPYPDASFDLVTCRVAPHHFSSPGKFVRESARVLKPGGWFLLIDGSVADDEPETEAWLHEVEKLRDPSHARFLSPNAWRALCEKSELRVASAHLHSRKQPDLEWYFEAAATAPENRSRVRQLIKTAPESVRRSLQLAEEDGKTVWWWHMVTVIARKP